MDVLGIEVGQPLREHEIERTTQPQRETQPATPTVVPQHKPAELPDPSVPLTPTPERVPA